MPAQASPLLAVVVNNASVYPRTRLCEISAETGTESSPPICAHRFFCHSAWAWL
jgi:hypothetical protein